VGLVLALVAAACGSGDGGRAGGDAAYDEVPAPTVGTTTASSPFVVEDPPDGYTLVLAGRGDYPQTWSSDSFGDDEPVTVLAPPGEDADSPEAVTVSLTGYAGFEGGLDQASAGYLDDTPEEFEIDGNRALYSPPGADAPEMPDADLVVAVGEDLAVRVRSADGSREELADVARRVRPLSEHLLAPQVPDPPDGLEVIGSADADVAITLWARPQPGSDTMPAGARAHTAAWARLDTRGAWISGASAITVSTLPGTAVSLDALDPALALRRYGVTATVQEASVRGRPAAVVDGGEDAIRFRAVVTSTPGGDALLVVASGGELRDAEVLVEVAASVQPATADAWDAFEVEARGGPGLRPDPGAVELERGEAEGTEWLFQARVDDGSVPLQGDDIDPATGRSTTEGEFVIDTCLKLTGGERACLGPGGSDSSSAKAHFVVRARGPLDDGGGFPGFIMASTGQPAAVLRVTAPDGVHEAPFHGLPGGQQRGAVVVTDLGGPWICDGQPRPPVTVELLDAAGHPLPYM
jgi:hypothetical protein